MDIFLVLIPYLAAKSLILFAESPEFDDFPSSMSISVSLGSVYFLLVLSAFGGQYSVLFPLLAISSLQLVSVKDGSYTGFLQTSGLIGVFILSIWLKKGWKMNLFTAGLVLLTASTGFTFLQSI